MPDLLPSPMNITLRTRCILWGAWTIFLIVLAQLVAKKLGPLKRTSPPPPHKEGQAFDLTALGWFSVDTNPAGRSETNWHYAWVGSERVRKDADAWYARNEYNWSNEVATLHPILIKLPTETGVWFQISVAVNSNGVVTSNIFRTKHSTNQ